MKKIKQFGVMAVYEFPDLVRPYIVKRTTDGKHMEEFLRRGSAEAWAKKNKNG